MSVSAADPGALARSKTASAASAARTTIAPAATAFGTVPIATGEATVDPAAAAATGQPAAVAPVPPPLPVDSYDGLDLCYVTNRIIVCGRPSMRSTDVADHRNNVKELVSFLEKKHPGDYMVFNLR